MDRALRTSTRELPQAPSASRLGALARYLRDQRVSIAADWEHAIAVRGREAHLRAIPDLVAGLASVVDELAMGRLSLEDEPGAELHGYADGPDVWIDFALVGRCIARRCVAEHIDVGVAELVVLDDLLEQAAGASARSHARRSQRSFDDAREDEQLLQSICEHSPSVIYVKDREHRYVFVNREFSRLFGRRAGDLVGASDEQLLEPALVQRVRAADRWVIETGEAGVFEERISTPMGERIFESVKFPLRDKAGYAHAVCGIATDITERKATEEALRRSETRYRLATECIADAIWDWDLTTNHLEWSRGAQTLFGYPSEEIRADSTWWSEHIHPEDRPRVLEHLRRLVAGVETEWSDEYRFLHREGHYVVVTDHAAIERDATGRGVRLIGAMQDVSALRAAQQQLVASEEQFRLLANSIPQLAWMADESGNIFWYNQRWYEYTGTTFDEMRGWGWQTVHHPDELSRVVARIRHAFATGTVWEDTFPLRGRDGQYRRFLSRAFPIRDASGRVVRWFGTNTDIEERLRVEEELQRRNEFEQQLIGIVSHDLRNPLSAVLLGCTVLIDRNTLGEREMELVQRVRRSADRAARLVNDLLDFTSERMGKGIPIENVPRDLHELTRSVLEELRLAHPGRVITETHEGDGNGSWDPDRLAQVITNLVGNALAYCEPNTPVEVSTCGDGDSVSIRVHNVGAPISPDVLARLFKPLERGPTTDPARRSVGLGLFIVDRIVHAHGGRIDVESSADRGTTFTIRLPRFAARA